MSVPYNPNEHVIDINHWEGIPHHRAIFAQGVRRAITKLTEGRNFGDPLAGYAFRRWHELAIHREAYHFLTVWDSPVEQIRVFYAALQGVFWQPGELIWLDLEGRSLSAAWRALGIVRIRKKLKPFILECLRACDRLIGVNPGIYCGASFWNSYVGPVDFHAEGLPQPKLWAPDYGWNGEGSGIAEPRWIDRTTWPNGWHRWQFTDQGRIAGIPGLVDLNRERDAMNNVVPPPADYADELRDVRKIRMIGARATPFMDRSQE